MLLPFQILKMEASVILMRLNTISVELDNRTILQLKVYKLLTEDVGCRSFSKFKPSIPHSLKIDIHSDEVSSSAW